MSLDRLRAARDWVFDLDNTLYPADSTMYDAIGMRMTEYIARAIGLDLKTAEALQERYFLEYGATVCGLVEHHGLDADAFMRNVHDVDASLVHPDPDLRALIAALPGRKFVFTNGGGGHAERMIARIGLDGLFADVVDLGGTGLKPKPQIGAYEAIIARCGIIPANTVLVEDTLRNLMPAHALGFVTALVGHVHPDPLPDYVDHTAPSVHDVLRAVLGVDRGDAAA